MTIGFYENLASAYYADLQAEVDRLCREALSPALDAHGENIEQTARTQPPLSGSTVLAESSATPRPGLCSPVRDNARGSDLPGVIQSTP